MESLTGGDPGNRAPRLAALRSGRGLWSANLALVAVIVVVDWLTPAGVVVGILLSVPILATSAAESRRVPLITFVAAAVGFIVAAWFGRGPIAPEEVWIPNRVLALLTLPMAYLLARDLQRRRQEAEQARDEARGASDVNRLLVSLLAHDLRAPLAMAVQALEYARTDPPPSARQDPTLLSDVQLRLRRSLGSIDQLLRFFSEGQLGGRDRAPGLVGPVDVRQAVESEAKAFEAEAASRGKTLRLDVGSEIDATHDIDVLVLRQALRILIDNALRHARPGEVLIRARLSRGTLHASVTDQGPMDGAPLRSEPAGSGVGLALCRALVGRAGGSMAMTTSPQRTTFEVRLPVQVGGEPESQDRAAPA